MAISQMLLNIVILLILYLTSQASRHQSITVDSLSTYYNIIIVVIEQPYIAGS